MVTPWLVLGKSPRGTIWARIHRGQGRVFAGIGGKNLLRVEALHQLVEEILMGPWDDHLVHEQALFGNEGGPGVDGGLHC